MIRAAVRADIKGFVEHFKRHSIQRLEQAALKATDRATRDAHRELRGAMDGARLGRLKNAVAVGTDLRDGRGVHRRGGDGFSASGRIYIRTRNERTVGAIESYTVGSTILPVNGRWLWIATADLQKRVGRRKITPARYNAAGLDVKIGPLVFVPGRNPGEALLVVKNVSVDRFGRGRVRRLPKRGPLGGSRERRDEVVLFVGIRRTTRIARVDPVPRFQDAARRVERLMREYLTNGR